MSDPETVAFYDRQTEAYKKLTENWENKHLTRLMATLPDGAHVLDLGCGPGQDSAQLVRGGFRVTAMDASPEMVQQAAKTEGVDARVATFSELSDEDVYDAVWASFSLLHAPKAEMPTHLAAIHRALKPGGTAVLSLKVGDGEARDKLGRFYSYYQEDELRGLMSEAGFEVTDVEYGVGKGMAGTNDPFMVMTAHA